MYVFMLPKLSLLNPGYYQFLPTSCQLHTVFHCRGIMLYKKCGLGAQSVGNQGTSFIFLNCMAISLLSS